MQPDRGRLGATCTFCGQAFRPGARILWRVQENTEEHFGWSATHLLCPRTLWNVLLGVLVVLAAVFFLVVLLLVTS